MRFAMELSGGHSTKFHAAICNYFTSCGSPQDPVKGVILSPPNLPGWDEVPIVKILQEEMGVPARMENDADACGVYA